MPGLFCELSLEDDEVSQLLAFRRTGTLACYPERAFLVCPHAEDGFLVLFQFQIGLEVGDFDAERGVARGYIELYCISLMDDDVTGRQALFGCLYIECFKVGPVIEQELARGGWLRS